MAEPIFLVDGEVRERFCEQGRTIAAEPIFQGVDGEVKKNSVSNVYNNCGKANLSR